MSYFIQLDAHLQQLVVPTPVPVPVHLESTVTFVPVAETTQVDCSATLRVELV